MLIGVEFELKKFIIGLLMIIMTLAIIALGVSFTIEKTITENIGTVIKEEITKEIVREVASKTNVDKEEIKKGLNKVLEENKALQKTLDESLDKAMDILSGKDVKDLDFSKELEDVIHNSEDVLKEYGIIITKEEKQELLDMVNSEEMNKELQSVVKEVQEDMPTSAKTVIDAFNFVRSTTFKSIIIVGIVVILLCIALLKKSTYKWLGNLSEATIMSGIFYSVIVPLFINVVNNDMASEHNIILSASSMNMYGYVLIGIGVVALILNTVLSKTLGVKQEKIQHE